MALQLILQGSETIRSTLALASGSPHHTVMALWVFLKVYPLTKVLITFRTVSEKIQKYRINLGVLHIGNQHNWISSQDYNSKNLVW